jgi:long-chain acyl-CoA synthetase
VSVSWAEVGEQVADVAAGLLELGLQPEERVGLASGTRYEWIVADLAVMAAGGATTTVYPTTNEEDTAYILADASARIVFVEDEVQLAKLQARRAELTDVTTVVRFDGPGDGSWVIGLGELAAKGAARRAAQPDELERIARAIAPDALATLIYTSGTTGRPKGVRLSHRSWVYEGEAIRSLGILDETDLQYLWLPMAHSFGKVLLSTQLACGFASAVDGRVDRVVDNLAVVRPTFMGAAPRIFEKAHGRIVTMAAAQGGVKQTLFERAFAVGLEIDRRRWAGEAVPPLLAAQRRLFDKLVFAKIRARFGGRVRFFISGAAALDQGIAEWFHAAGVLILEGYGLTETSAGTVVNRLDDYRLGTVGTVLPGTEVRLGLDDEVLVRGPGVMQGYHGLPEETARVLDADGWLHTGDRGSLDETGHLTITGRIKELFKTSGGKYVAPPVIEARFKAICPYVGQFLVVGDQRPYCVALVSLDPEALAGWAEANGRAGVPYAELIASDEVRALVGRYVDELNAGLNRWETIKRWALLDHDLSIDDGELTPSMKVRRSFVTDRHRAMIDALYD